jgi:hypothetical protein
MRIVASLSAMGLFDWFKKKSTPSPDTGAGEPCQDDTSAPGWMAINQVFERLYPGQTHPRHRAQLFYHMNDISGDEAFDGISAYDAGDYWHFLTYGLSELYGKVCKDPVRSGFGYEFTFKLTKDASVPPVWAFQMLDTIGKRVWKNAVFAAGHTIKTGPIDGHAQTVENALLILHDPAVPEPIATPHGSLEFLLLFGVMEKVRQRMLAAYEANGGQPGWEATIVAELREKNPNLVTTLTRK